MIIGGFKLKGKEKKKKINICDFYLTEKCYKILDFSTLRVPGEQKLDLHKTFFPCYRLRISSERTLQVKF